MRIRLPESERTRARRPGAALASALLHGAIIALAMSTAADAPRAEPAPPPPMLVYHAPPPLPIDARASDAQAGAPASGAPRRTTPTPPDVRASELRAPDLAMSGPIAIAPALPAAGPAAPAFDGGAMRGIGGTGASGSPPAGGGPLDARHVERAAAPLGEIRPRYPDALRARGADGAVLARYVVDDAGRVQVGSVVIAEATDSLLAASVRAALREARFRPAEVGGRPVAQLVEQRFLFALRGR